MKAYVCKLWPRIALRVLNDCLQMSKDARPTDPVKRRYPEDVELRMEKSKDPLERLNNISRSINFAFIHPETNVVFICLRASSFWNIVSKKIGIVSSCTSLYCPSGEYEPMVFTYKV